MKKTLIALTLALISFSVSAQETDPFDIVKSSYYGFELLKVANSRYNDFTNRMNLQADGYFFEVRGDSIRAEVPFVGQMTNPSPGLETNAIRIKGTIKDPEVREMSKGKKLYVTFKAYSDYSKEMFDIVLTVTKSGSSDLMLKSSKRDNITFFGRIYSPDSSSK